MKCHRGCKPWTLSRNHLHQGPAKWRGVISHRANRSLETSSEPLASSAHSITQLRPAPLAVGYTQPASHPPDQRKQLELSWGRFTLATFPMLPCTLAPLPALFQHRLHSGFQDLFLLRDFFYLCQPSCLQDLSCLGCR